MHSPKALGSLVGWIAALAALAWGLARNQQQVSLRQEVSRLEALLAEQQPALARLPELEAAARQSAVELEGLRQQLAARTPAPVAPSPAEPAPPTEATSAETTASPTPAEQPPADALDGEKILRSQMAIVVDMAYKELFDELPINAELLPQLRDRIVTAATKEREAIVEAMKSGTVPASEVKKKKDAIKEALQADLTQMLDSAAMAAWQEYDKYADQNLYETLLDGQLAMLASGLTEENRRLAKQVIAEQLARSINAFEESDQFYTLANFNTAQAGALEASLNRLVEVLDTEQYGQVQKFTDIAVAAFRTQSQ